MGNDTLLKMENIVKKYPGTLALSKVNFILNKGEIHCLVGENGAGKSTLIKIITGAIQKDEGKIYINGEEVKINNPQDSKKFAIRVIYQELDLMPSLSVAENIMIENEPKNFLNLINWNSMYQKAEKILKILNVKINVKEEVNNLTIAEQQIVAIAKALSQKSQIFILDEPSAVLSGAELEKLFNVIKELKEQGAGIIYITHRLKEIFDIGDRLTVLRDGKFISTEKVSNVNEEQIIKWTIGRELTNKFYKKKIKIKEEILRIKNLSVQGKLKDINLSLRRGEILGIAGLMGAGRTELLKTIFGLYKKNTGDIFINDKKVEINNPQDALMNGISLIPEDRKNEGLVLGLNIEENISVAILVKESSKIINHIKLLEKIINVVHDLNIKAYSLKQTVLSLSGGNQQKIVIAKWLATNSNILLLDEPTRGIDVGSKLELYKLIAKMIENGSSVIIVSSELAELIAISDRILVMANGQIKKEFDAKNMSEKKILKYCHSL